MKNGAVHRSIAAGALALVAAGCGGGGDAAPNPPPQGNTVAASAAHRDLLASARSRAVTGVGSDNRNYRLDLVITPLAAAAFPATGTMAARSVLQLDVAIDGQPSSQGRLTYHFDLADMRIAWRRRPPARSARAHASPSRRPASRRSRSSPATTERSASGDSARKRSGDGFDRRPRDKADPGDQDEDMDAIVDPVHDLAEQ
jgi:hypothetical protein